ncbi:MAG: TfuA-related McrA-glycine thioamidation protein [Methanomicrobiales archaeon]|nr:TfuA-related McrA-glycine thioamidation protein [Methanomicrobiales archaeon]
MRHELVVYLGPSLPLRDAEQVLPAEYLPPAKRGDIPLAVRNGARIICLIDGVFFQDCSVGHREILAAIGKNVRVIGSSSMGALRASELDTLGMEGIGEVYRLYKSGDVESDDEVALIFDPESGIALSIPLVNIRHILALAEEQGIIDRIQKDYLFRTAQSLYFPDRTWDRIRELACGKIPALTLDTFIQYAEDGPDLKREDAIQALNYTRNVAEELGIL